MVVKKVENPDKSASKRTRIRSLARYILAPETENAKEKCIQVVAHGFLSNDREVQIAEMVALAQDATRSGDPILHVVLSWQRSERPTPDQVKETVDIVRKELDVPRHQILAALHSDTDNVHLHLMLNRTDPDTLKVTKINGGFDVKALHRVVARVEHVQGWKPQKNARYRVDGRGNVVRTKRTRYKERVPQPTQLQIDRERRTGEKSAARIAIEVAGPIIEGAGCWEDVHAGLAKEGMRYERTGSGATVYVGDIPVKASTVSRNATLAKLEERLGPHLPAGMESTNTGRKESRSTADPSRAWPIINPARSWIELHRALAEHDMRYVRVGKGARVHVGDEVFPAGEVSLEATLPRLEARLGPYSSAGDLGVEVESGERARKGAKRKAPDPKCAWPIIRDAKTWKELHCSLAEHGLRYVRTGSGATIYAGDCNDLSMKASSVSRKAALRPLEARLGPFEPAPETDLPNRAPEPVHDVPRWDEYIKARSRQEEARRFDQAKLDRECVVEEDRLRLRHQAERDALFRARSWKGRVRELRLAQSLLAHRHAAENAALNQELRTRREALRTAYPAWPDFVIWVDDPQLVVLWQTRRTQVPFFEPADATAHRTSKRPKGDIRDFQGRQAGKWVIYTTAAHRRKDQVAFVDRGARITVHDRKTRSSMLAALQLASAKWGRVVVRGSAEFKHESARLAAIHGIESRQSGASGRHPRLPTGD